MPREVASASTTVRQKPTTRSSIRQSLGFSSMGRVLADVMHKESKESKDSDKDKEKSSKKAKEIASRRTSIGPPPRHSVDVPPSSRREKVPSPVETKPVTRHSRRASVIPKPPPPLSSSADERSSSPSSVISPKGPVTRASALRAKTALNPSSALPKYRPRSLLAEQAIPKKPPSPVRNAFRRESSTSDDEREDEPRKGKGALQLDVEPVHEKASSKISPRSRVNALKVNLTAAINVRPTTPEKTAKPGTPNSQATPTGPRLSPTRFPKESPSRSIKSSAAPSSFRGHRPRAPSETSSSSSTHSPHTPKTPSSIKGIFGSGQKNGGTGSSVPKNIPPHPDSPLGRLSARKNGGKSSPTPTPQQHPNTTQLSTIFTEGSSVDSLDADDVEFMLSTIASPSAPTPAIPRFRKMNSQDSHDNYDPHTPSRPGFLPTRANLSYVSPAPPSSDSSPFLRPNPRKPGNDRGSILSWEQLTSQSQSLGPEDIGSMLSEIPAPFRPGAISPTPSSLPDIPESPGFSTLPSPTSYGSISQVLLPDVTPSPAVFNVTQRFEQLPPDGLGDGAVVMQLRLQIASIENTNQLQLVRIQSLEDQLQSAKQARLADASELAKQISDLEEKIHGNLRTEEQRTDHITSLEDQLMKGKMERERAVAEAMKKAAERAAKERAAAVKVFNAKWSLADAAREAGACWRTVGSVAEGELEMIRASREMLSVLLAGLAQSQRQLKCPC